MINGVNKWLNGRFALINRKGVFIYSSIWSNFKIY